MRGLVATAALLAIAACTPLQTAVLSCYAPLKPAVEVDLFFGGDAGQGRAVSDAEWASFMADEVSAGLTFADFRGRLYPPSQSTVLGTFRP